jgi:hypothetical protein
MNILRRHIRRWRQRRWEKRYLESGGWPDGPTSTVSVRRYSRGHRRSFSDRFDIFPA